MIQGVATVQSLKNDDDWDSCMLVLADCILWDRDFLDEVIYDGSDYLPGYFAAEPPDWSSSEKRELLSFYQQAADEVAAAEKVTDEEEAA